MGLDYYGDSTIIAVVIQIISVVSTNIMDHMKRFLKIMASKDIK